MVQLALPTEPSAKDLSPFLEMGAYETLWSETSSFPRLASRFRERPDALPSDLVDHETALTASKKVVEKLRSAGIERFGVRIHGALEYPEKLRDARNPVELLYYQGWWNFVESACVAVVGTRAPSPEGAQLARRLVKLLVEHDRTIVSGLAKGIDTIAHETALAARGRTIAVLGTPLNRPYPRENEPLQRRIAEQFLLISQVPVLGYDELGHNIRRGLFPQRNITMSALSGATIIVEVNQSRGSFSQAKAALDQGRTLILLPPCFDKPDVTWPEELLAKGAIRAESEEDAIDALPADAN